MGVVVPVYNEEAGLERGIAAIRAAVQRYRGRAVLIAVDDGSADAAASPRRASTASTVVHHAQNAGYGAALRTGADRAARARPRVRDVHGLATSRTRPRTC